jgi:hypothetical protein
MPIYAPALGLLLLVLSAPLQSMAQIQTSPLVVAECPQLDSQLAQLVESDDPLGFAATHRLSLDDNRAVRVIVVLAGPAEPDPAAYGLIPEARVADLLQARVEIDQLCSQAADADVIAVRPPAIFVPDGQTIGGSAH